MKWVVRAFAVAMVAGGIFMGYYAGTELVAVTGLFQWDLAVAWWFIGFVGGTLFLTLDIVLSHLPPAEHSNITKTERNTEKSKMTNIDRLTRNKDRLNINKHKVNINNNKVNMEKKKMDPENFEAKRIGFTKREPPNSKTM
ncbi:hypothetical protein [Paenibacillus thiaminolyticus]|uniref:Uncharacterized protein n=1 Tax=Paenibacillus thiaminolyticus TaxID=49283 RepID=A0A3A3GLA5_PANTH|nr:hypothetical protein [Paenibacillus thiaminolyticus]RJG25929.1 hypothetical protein DQX05_03245 [Paenibacillus thiaminolyticus]